MTQANSRNGFLRRLTVLTMVVIVVVIISACAAPAAAPSPQTAPTQTPAATDAPTQALASTDAPAATDAPIEAATLTPAVSTGGALSFSKDVMPILETSCIKCHGGQDGKKGDLDLRTHETVIKGGKDGQVVVPGDAANSMLVKLISEGKMPKRGSKLAQAQIDLIAKWVSEGALDN